MDGEVLGGAGDGARGRQGPWNVLQGEAGRADLHGQPHHEEPLGAFESPAVTWIYVRLGKGQNTKNLRKRNSKRLVMLKYKENFCMVKNHMQYSKTDKRQL